jgi:hypothetical protein
MAIERDGEYPNGAHPSVMLAATKDLQSNFWHLARCAFHNIVRNTYTPHQIVF